MNQDLHKLKASAIFNVSYEEVTNEQRQYAKTISFFNNYYQEGVSMQPHFMKPFKATHIVVPTEVVGNYGFPVGTLLERQCDDLYRDADGVHEFINDCFVEEIVK